MWWRCLLALYVLQPALDIPPPPPLAVIEVRLRGNKTINDDAIRPLLKTRSGARLNQELLREDVRALWRMGHFENVRVEVNEAKRGAVVVFQLDEKPSVRRIYVSGNDAISLKDINGVLDLRRGEILNLAKVRQNADKIRELYEQHGHYLADVRHEIQRRRTAEADVYFRIREGSSTVVGRINFVGNRVFSDADLLDLIATRPPTVFSAVTGTGVLRKDTVERDAQLLLAHYLDRGYVYAKVDPPMVEISADGRYAHVTFSIFEGKQYRTGEVDITGDLIVPKAELLRLLQAQRRQTFSRTALTQVIEEINTRYRDRGYAYANITPQTEIREDAGRVDITIEIERGPLVTVERIYIVGNTKTRDKVIRRELRLHEADLFSQSALDESKRRVMATGYFRRVEVATKRGSRDDRIIVTVQVAERSTGSFQAGVGFSSVENVVVHAQIAQFNLFGRGQTLLLNAQISGLRRFFALQFQEPYFLDTPLVFGFSTYNQQRAYIGFVRESTGGSITWGYLVTDDLRLFFTQTVEQVAVSSRRGGGFFSPGAENPIPAGAFASLTRSGLTSAPQLSLVYDTRDNRIITTRGQFHTASIEVADQYVGSENTFARAEGTMRFFRPLIGPLLFRLRLQAGLIVSHEPEGVPIYERFFLGGIYDVRGFRPRSLGPRIRLGTTPGDPQVDLFGIGGNAQVFGNMEVEIPIFRRIGIRGVLFLDAGNTFNLEGQHCGLGPFNRDPGFDPCIDGFEPKALRYSWGFGMRWFSPIGPLRFEWGIPFRRLPGEESSVFEFTVGNAF